LASSTEKATPALLLRQNRRAWLLLRKLEGLTSETLLEHWRQALRGLILGDSNRSWLLQLLNSIHSKKDLSFWNCLQQPEKSRQAERRWPALTAGQREKLGVSDQIVLSFVDRYMGENDWEKAILRKVCVSLASTGARPAPSKPFPSQEAVAFSARGLASGAQQQRTALSSWLRNFWEQKHFSALIAIVNGDGVKETWVQDAIAELQRLQVEGDPNGYEGKFSERERATADLRRLGKALGEVGKGKDALRSETERQVRKRASDQRSGKKRKQRFSATKLNEKIQQQSHALRHQMGRSEQEARNEAVQFVESQFRSTSRSQSKKETIELARTLRSPKPQSPRVR